MKRLVPSLCRPHNLCSKRLDNVLMQRASAFRKPCAGLKNSIGVMEHRTECSVRSTADREIAGSIQRRPMHELGLLAASRDPDMAFARNKLRKKPASHRHRNSWRVILAADKHAKIQPGACLDLWCLAERDLRVGSRNKRQRTQTPKGGTTNGITPDT